MILSGILIWFLSTETMVHGSLLKESLGHFYIKSNFQYFASKISLIVMVVARICLVYQS